MLTTKDKDYYCHNCKIKIEKFCWTTHNKSTVYYCPNCAYTFCWLDYDDRVVRITCQSRHKGMDITVPSEFVIDLLKCYAFKTQLGGSSDVSYNRPENSIRRLCKATGVSKEQEEYFAAIVEGRNPTLKITC